MLPNDKALLDQIEAIRARNNRYWMDLVRLALEHAPDEARALLRKIAYEDNQVRQLTEQLAGPPVFPEIRAEDLVEE